MIAGEGMVRGMNNSYFGFDGFNLKPKPKSKPKASEEDKAKKKQALKDKGQKLITGLKTQIDKAGGVKGILDTANNVKKFVKDDSPTTPDFDVNAGNKQMEAAEKKGIPVLVWVIGGVALLVTGTFIVVHMRNKSVGKIASRATTYNPPISSNNPPSAHL